MLEGDEAAATVVAGIEVTNHAAGEYDLVAFGSFHRRICQNSGLWCRQGPDPGLTMPTLRYEMGRLLALQTATIALAP